MSGEETFEFAAAVAGVSIGLAAALLLSLLAVVGSWRFFRHASDASESARRASLTVEELARRLAVDNTVPTEQFAALREQAQALMGEQARLHEMMRELLETVTVETGTGPAGTDDLERAVNRLDATVGQMATSLANLIQLLERQQSRR